VGIFLRFRALRTDAPSEPAPLANPAPRADATARLLEACLAVGIVAAPFPFGAVPAAGRLALELGAFALLLVWAARAWAGRPTALPPRPVIWGLAGLLLLTTLQALPLGGGIVGSLSPRALSLRAESLPPAALGQVERRLLGIDPTRLDTPAALSLDPGGTASALRTGAALAAVLLVSTTVAATSGARRLALALLFGAAFQGLYGLLVTASGHDRIWHVAKKYYLDSATGTFVNPNHFAGLLAMSLPCGVALIHDNSRRQRVRAARGAAAWLGGSGSRNWLLWLLVVVGASGLLLSYSRAGIALGLLALGLTLLGAGRHQGLRARLIVAILVVAAAVLPLLQIGAGRLLARYAASPSELSGARVQVWIDTLSLFAAQPLAGCGFGAFAASYPLVRSQEVRQFFAHAHNDPVQLLAEGGALGATLFLLALVPVAARAIRAIAGDRGPLAVGFAAGLVAAMLHSLVDFTFHIPSNAATAAVLAGVLLGLPCRPPTSS